VEPVIQKEKKRHQKRQQTLVSWKRQSWTTMTLPFTIALDSPCPAEKNLARRWAWMFPNDESKNLQKFWKWSALNDRHHPDTVEFVPLSWRKTRMTIWYLCLPPDSLSSDDKKVQETMLVSARQRVVCPWLTKGAGNHKVTPHVTWLHGSRRQKVQETMLVSTCYRALGLMDSKRMFIQIPTWVFPPAP